MRTCIRSSCFLILFTIFSISILLSSAVAQNLGQTFESYQPPAIACERAGAWAPVDSNGNGIKQNSRVQFGVFTCEVASPGPGEAGKFNGISERDPNSYRYVFAKPGNPDTGNVTGLPGTDATYNFNTGIWTTSAGQFRDGINIASPIESPSLPVVIGTYNSPPGQSLSPSQSALEAAKRAKQEAEQQVTTAQSALEQANAARVAAEEQLASAQTALETATAAEQAALAANAEQLQVAEQAQTDAEQQLANAQTTLDAANTKLQELEQQIADARTKVADANDAKRLAEQALAKAVNEVRKIKGIPALPVVGGDYSGPAGDLGNNETPSSSTTPTEQLSEEALATLIKSAIERRDRNLDISQFGNLIGLCGEVMLNPPEEFANLGLAGQSLAAQANDNCNRLRSIIKELPPFDAGNQIFAQLDGLFRGTVGGLVKGFVGWYGRR
jgi:hypothetical protein